VTSEGVRIQRLGPADAAIVEAAGDLFDHAPQPEATRKFLAEPGHHLLVAFEGDDPAGFITGVEVTHPDKGTEMFVYELGVRESSRRRGIASALVEALGALARERGCYGMWVLTERDNEAALRTYARAGARAPSDQVMFDWAWETRPAREGQT
jgi:ribosomal protein S18 acetylase RimI-like enzyme